MNIRERAVQLLEAHGRYNGSTAGKYRYSIRYNGTTYHAADTAKLADQLVAVIRKEDERAAAAKLV